MKFLILLLFLIPISAYCQDKCEIAYVHVYKVLDSLPVTPDIQAKCKVVADSLSQSISIRKKEYKKKYKDSKVVDRKIKQDIKNDSAVYLKTKRTLMQKVYMKKINQATMVIYDKGKIYNSVINADSPIFAKLPDKSCDETWNCLKIVRGMLK